MKNLITSKDNSILKMAKALLHQSRQRKKLGKTIIEGTHLIDALLRTNIDKNPLIETVIVGENALKNPEVTDLLKKIKLLSTKITILFISDYLYKEIRSLGESPAIMAIIQQPKPLLQKEITEDCLIINGIQDNGNLGTLLRTSASVGIHHIICTDGTASAWSPKTLRASMGANFSLIIYENVTIEALLTWVNVPMFATSSHTNRLIYHENLTKPLALIMGNEGQGVEKQLMAQSQLLGLPQPNGQESLNVAIAGALCMYEMLRQRKYS